jgi:hypothetical protein
MLGEIAPDLIETMSVILSQNLPRAIHAISKKAE